MTTKIKIGIVGATGYTGVELLRLLSSHPNAEVTAVTSRSEAGIAVADYFPSLRGIYDLTFQTPEEAGLDLVEVAPNAKPPVAKLMDYGKYKYEAAQKARDARRNQANTQLKEIRFRLKIDDHDFGVKKGHVERFLSAGDKVKVMIMFRGREQSRPEAGVRLLQRLAEEIGDLATVESMPRQDGRNMTMVLAPTKRKADALTEQRKRREAERAERRGKRAERASKDQARVAADKADEQD